MPRRPRINPGNLLYHVVNRSAGRRPLFRHDADYAAFEKALAHACQHVPMRILAYCLMPSHWHLVLWPRADGQLSRFMQWLTVTHMRRWHAHRRSTGTGPLYQGRFKSFPIQQDRHLLAVCRYVERNPLRAGLVKRAQSRPWSSLTRRLNDRPSWQLDPHDWPARPPPTGFNWSTDRNRTPSLKQSAAPSSGARPLATPSGSNVSGRD